MQVIVALFSVISPLNLADSLYSSRNFYDAATEYGRFLFEFPLDSNSIYAEFQLGLSFLNGKEKEKGENTLSNITKFSNPYSKKAQKVLIDYFIENKEFSRAKLEINDLIIFTHDSNEVVRFNNRLGWISLEESDFKQAENYFLLSNDTLMVNETKNLKRLKYKRPITAMILSTILPGTGEIYNGHYWTGIFSFFINAASIFGIVHSINRKNYIDASLIFSIFFSRFYFGSRQNAYDFANEFNQKIYEDRLRKLKQNNSFVQH